MNIIFPSPFWFIFKNHTLIILGWKKLASIDPIKNIYTDTIIEKSAIAKEMITTNINSKINSIYMIDLDDSKEKGIN